MKTVILAVAALALGPACSAQTLESAQERWSEIAARQEVDVARGGLERSAAGIREYAAALEALPPKIAVLTAEAAGKESFDLHWGGAELYEVSDLLSWNRPAADGVTDGNVRWKPHSAWWGIWSAHRLKRVPTDPEFRAAARRTVEALDGALRALDALEGSLLDLYGTLVRKGVGGSGAMSGSDMRMAEIAYRRADFLKMRTQAAAFTEGRRARMKDPADW